MNRVRNILIFGGGTSGWLTAAYLVKNLKTPCNITLLEDKDMGPIGVGEGTQPFTAQFLYQCGFNPKDWMKPSKATYKLGVELTGWNEQPYFVDNDTMDSSFIANDFYTSDYFVAKNPSEFIDWHPAYRLAKSNKSPKFYEHYDANFGIGPEGMGAVHFDAYAILDTIKSLIGNKIKHINTKIVSVQNDIYGITKLVDDNNCEYTADLFLDCTGFAAQLIGQTLKTDFVSYNKWLPNDRAVVVQTEYTDPEQQCHPYTKATTMTSGWRFTIPVFHRVGNGYIYSSQFISDEAAEAELRNSVNEHNKPVRFLKMKCGYHKEIAVKNVVAVGLSAGFVEPLEATGITFTTGVVSSLCSLLNLNSNLWDQKTKSMLNTGFYRMSMEILAFVWSHYYFSKRQDTEYWQNIRKMNLEDLPTDAQKIIQSFYPRLGRFYFFSPESMFNVVQWFSVINASGAYLNTDNHQSVEQSKYGKYFLDSHTHRVDMAIDLFDNHHRYLKRWYNED